MSEIRRAFAALPVAGDILQGRKALLLSPHPDDESLGAGGLIAQAAAAGNAPHIVFLTDGAASHPESRAFPPVRLADLRETEALAATAALGVPPQNVSFRRQPDGALPAAGAGFDMLVGKLADLAASHQCHIIIAAWGHDPHCDHEAGAALARALARRVGLPLLYYPVWGLLRPDTDEIALTHIAGWRLDIAPYLAAKRAAVSAHRSQAGLVITDAPDGFSLPPPLLEACLTNFELYLEA